MTCPDCYPILNELDLLPTGLVTLCPKHAMVERLVEALRRARRGDLDFVDGLLKEYDQLEGRSAE